MFTKSILACAAAVVVSSATAVFAYEDPENKLGDRYPFLEQAYQPTAASRSVGRYVTPRQVVSLNQSINEDSENRLSDRYPFLEQAYQPTAASRSVGLYVTPRQASYLAQYSSEAPENKISDRYPLLEQQIAYQSGPTRRVVASRRAATVR